MVDFTFNTYGYAFEEGVTRLLDAYQLASHALQGHGRELEAELTAYNAAVVAGRPVVGEWDDGHWLWTQDQLLELQVEDAHHSLRDLRRSFIVMLYHHWERWTRRQLDTHTGNHDALVALAARHGMQVHPDLGSVRDLANLFKHANKKWGIALLTSWPSLIPDHLRADSEVDWYEAVVLDDGRVSEVAEIVKASGPRRNEAYP